MMKEMLRFRAVTGFLVALAAAIAIWASCAVYDTSLLVTADAGDAAPNDAAPEGGCVHAFVPERPTSDGPTLLDGGELTFAVSRFDFAPNVVDGGRLRGYDLDRNCTCPGPPSCKSPRQQCDDDAGRDNVGGLQLDNFAKFADSFTPGKINTRLASGLYGLLIRLRNWNGSPNDGTVEAAIYVSKGTPTTGDAGAHVLPKFDGTDVFTVAQASLLGGVAPPYIPLPDAVDTTAYVRDGVLVASGTNIRVELSTSDQGLNYLDMSLTNTFVTATITKTGNGYRLDDGVIAGRWPVRKFLLALAPQYDPIGGGFLCGDASTYETVRGVACQAVDISSAIQNDNTNATCDAFSTALGFAAVPVIFGPVSAGVPLQQPCGPLWSDDCPPQ